MQHDGSLSAGPRHVTPKLFILDDIDELEQFYSYNGD